MGLMLGLRIEGGCWVGGGLVGGMVVLVWMRCAFWRCLGRRRERSLGAWLGDMLG